MPTKDTAFLPIGEIAAYEAQGYFCMKIEFDPAGSVNRYFEGCPPFILMAPSDRLDSDVYFAIPETVAYYAIQHAGFTDKGRDRLAKRARREMADEFKKLLHLK